MGMGKMYIESRGVERGLRRIDPWYTRPQAPIPHKASHQDVPRPPI